MAVNKKYRIRLINHPPEVPWHEIDANTCTVEPSGALTFWHVTSDNQHSILLLAFGVYEWVQVELVIPEAPPVRTCANNECMNPVLGNLAVCFKHAVAGPDGQPTNPL